MFGASGTIKAVAVLVIVLVIGFGLWYVTNLKANLAISQANEQKLKDAAEVQSQYIETLKQDFAKIQSINADIVENNARLDKQVKELKNKFNQSKNGNPRDFGVLAIAKPRPIEKIINKASNNVNRCFEIVSGSPLTEKEINAKLKSEINNECPSIANPNYTPVTP